MQLPIFLIGPMYAGKSTIASILAEKLDVPETSVDAIVRNYYLKDGIDPKKLEEAEHAEDFEEYVRYVSPFELKAIITICHEYKDTIISFGAGHSHFLDSGDIEKLLSLKDLTPNIFLLLPSSDAETSITILNQRMVADREEVMSEAKLQSRMKVNKNFIASASNKKFASHEIFTEGKTPDEIADEIISRSQ